MEFWIADSFIDSLARLTGDEQKAVKTTAFDLQMNPANPGMQFHKLDKARDKHFWSVRVSSDIRLIIHKTAGSLLLCFVNHHDKAYDWAERRKLEVHPKTGAAQFVEVREKLLEIQVPAYTQQAPKAKQRLKLFAEIDDDTLLGYGIPQEWLQEVKSADEDSLLELSDHLPSEAAEALLEIATGGQPKEPILIAAEPEVKYLRATPNSESFDHPDALRRFRVLKDVEELQRALESPWDKWAIFLHPDQQQVVDRNYSGPARVSGSAGTGKTIVAVHRAVHLARNNPESRVLLTTFSSLLANSLKIKVRRLTSNTPAISERLDVLPIHEVGLRLYKSNIGAPSVVSDDGVKAIIKQAMSSVEGIKYSQAFLFSEWQQIVDAWQLQTWEEYRDVKRLGRKTRLPEQQRRILWDIFSRVNDQIKKEGTLTWSGLFDQLTKFFVASKKRPYDFVVVDESQDISIAELRFLSALDGGRQNALFFAGDLGQRIFQQPFSWKSVGVDIRGRSSSLRVNYRTSHQIRMQSDRLLGQEVSDADGVVEKRNAISVFNGPSPEVKIFKKSKDESEFVGNWIAALLKQGFAPHEIGVFVRSANELDRAVAALSSAKTPYKLLDESVEAIGGHVAVSTMHLAKGLEFKAVAVMACDDEVIPLQSRIESVTDDSDLEEVYNTERHLLYVACTRARDQLLVTGMEPGSEFLEDFRSTM